jgi:uncharacterized membrane protein (DUF485 family)
MCKTKKCHIPEIIDLVEDKVRNRFLLGLIVLMMYIVVVLVFSFSTTTTNGNPT